MDGFDDLLGPTRAALERNPFADPFGRSSSPDPWKSFQPTELTTEHEDSTSAAFGTEERSTTPTLEDPGFAGTSATNAESPFEPGPTSVDPLDSAKALQEYEDEAAPSHQREPSTPTDHAPLGTPKSPGFRESVSTTIDDVLTPAPAERQPTPPRIASPPLAVNVSAPTASTSPPPTSPAESSALSSASIMGHAPDSSFASPSSTPFMQNTARPFYSPLDQPQSLERSFSGLALGGESANGWQSMGQGSQSMFVGESPRKPVVPDDDDDDDDKPILQARMSSLERAQRNGAPSVPVSPHYPMSLTMSLFTGFTT